MYFSLFFIMTSSSLFCFHQVEVWIQRKKKAQKLDDHSSVRILKKYFFTFLTYHAKRWIIIILFLRSYFWSNLRNGQLTRNASQHLALTRISKRRLFLTFFTLDLRFQRGAKQKKNQPKLRILQKISMMKMKPTH